MSGKYYVSARNHDEYIWNYGCFTNSFLKFIFVTIKCLIKYDIVISKRNKSEADKVVKGVIYKPLHEGDIHK